MELPYLDRILEKRKKEGKRIEIMTLSTGQKVTVIGDLNVKTLVETALAQLS